MVGSLSFPIIRLKISEVLFSSTGELIVTDGLGQTNLWNVDGQHIALLEHDGDRLFDTVF